MSGNEADREKSAMRELLNAKTDEQELSPSKTGTANFRFVAFPGFPAFLAVFSQNTADLARIPGTYRVRGGVIIASRIQGIHYEKSSNGKISKSPRHRRRRHKYQTASNRAEDSRKIASGPSMTASKMVREVKNCAKDWTFNRVSLGYPGPVINGHPLREPHNLGGGWMKFNFREAFGCPVKVINDAAMQALGSYKGGRMLSPVWHWPWVGNDCGWNSGADGTGASNL